MNKINFSSNHILILGFGKEGRSSYKYVRSQDPKQLITIADSNVRISDDQELIADEHLNFQLGDDYLDDLNQYDLILRSPGIHPKHLSHFQGRVTSQTELFIEQYGKQCIGITGTKGKSSTSKLLYEMLQNAGRRVLLGGNIGIPVFDLIDDLHDDSLVVLELSCHQLYEIKCSPKYAIILNLFQEHLDYYDSVLEYYLAKLNIAKFQSENDYCFINADNKELNELIDNNNYKSEIVKCSLTDHFSQSYVILKDHQILSKNDQRIVMKVDDYPLLRQRHILANVLVVLNLIYILDVPIEPVKETLNSFEGLEHRLERFGIYHGIEFINDSISTIPESGIAALESFENVSSIILGGMNRGIDYSPFVEYLVSAKISTIICIDETGKLIYDALSSQDLPDKNVVYEVDIEHAVKRAYALDAPGTICLFSPAASSYNTFKNFEERGRYFKATVKRLANN